MHHSLFRERGKVRSMDSSYPQKTTLLASGSSFDQLPRSIGVVLFQLK